MAGWFRLVAGSPVIPRAVKAQVEDVWWNFFLYTSSIRYTTVYTISNLDLKSQRHQEKDICVLELGLGTI